jgi:hypothetical protein
LQIIKFEKHLLGEYINLILMVMRLLDKFIKSPEHNSS